MSPPRASDCLAPYSNRLPEVIRVEEARELLIDIDNVDIALAVIPHNRLAELAPRPVLGLVALDINTQAAVDAEAQQHLVVDGVAAALVGHALDALQLELAQAALQVGGAGREALRLDLEVRGRLGRAELLRVEARDLRGVRRGRVRGRELLVLRLLRVELAREFCGRRGSC